MRVGRTRITAVVLAAVVVAGVWFFVGRRPASSIRNVLLISIDTLRADHLSCYGHDKPTTPHIDALAKEGVLFEHVVAPVPLTLPSHCSMLTGTNPTYHGVHDNIMYRLGDEANVTLAELLKGHGFTTGAIVSASVLDSRFGLHQGFETYDQVGGPGASAGEGQERRAGQTNRVALDWLDRHRDVPFFLFLHYYDPHTPYDPPAPFASRFASSPYAGEVAYADDCVGRIIARFEELDLYDSTLIVIVGDHGEMLGEHGEPAHDFFIYQSAIRVPLVIKVPGRRRPQRVKSVVGVIDVVPTVCRLLSIEAPPGIQGVDLTPAWRGPATTSMRGVYCQSLTPTKYDANSLLGIVTDRWKFIQTTRPELYDLAADPREEKNLVQTHPTEAGRLQDLLKQTLIEERRDTAARQTSVDPEVERKLGALGYTGSPVIEDFELGREKDDPKDLIALHVSYDKINHLINERQIAEAHEIAQEVRHQRPTFLGGHLKLAEIAMRRNRPAEAITHLQGALQIRGDHAQSHHNLAQALLMVGRRDDAIRHFRRALALQPTLAEAHYGLGTALLNQGRVDDGVNHFHRALALNPTLAEAHYGLGMALLNQGRPQLAVQSLRQAATLDPNRSDLLNSVAWVLATHPSDDVRDPRNALQFAQRAAQLTRHREPVVLDTLAAAFAANGHFDQAAQTAKQAMTLARRSNPDQAQQIGTRLRLYQKKQPYRAAAPAP